MSLTDDWTAELQLAEFDRLTASVRRWIESAPVSPSFEQARVLWARISPRLTELQLDLNRVLIVGVLGGTGAGKSTLVNSLIGERVCAAGDIVRPTTTRPVVIAPDELDLDFLGFGDIEPEIIRRTIPGLKEVVLIDCPDPDTQSQNENGDGNKNRDLLRSILPHCDVLLCAGTAQKYKTQRVADELLNHAAGRQIVFVQTHAAVDADITADWKRHLESRGFQVPQIFRIDSEAALERIQQRLPPPVEFDRLVDFLRTELSGRAAVRILRSNALELLGWFLAEVKQEVDPTLSAIEKLQSAIHAERVRLLEQVCGRLKEQIGANQGVLRARLLREVTLRWSWGAFAGFLRLIGSARSWLGFLPLLRARGLAPMVIAGGIGVGRAVAQRIRESTSSGGVIELAEVGIYPGEIAQSQSVIAGFAHEAGIEPPEAESRRRPMDAESIVAPVERLLEQVEGVLEATVERRAARRAGPLMHALFELVFTALPAVLLWRLAKNFFYEHLWLEPPRPLLGLDYLLLSALWVLLWGLLLRGLLAWNLQRGLKRQLIKQAETLNPTTTIEGLFDEFAKPAAAVKSHAANLASLQLEADRLRAALNGGELPRFGRLKVAGADRGPNSPVPAAAKTS